MLDIVGSRPHTGPMTSNTVATVATPKPHTIVLMATCDACRGEIAQTYGGDFPWYHVETGSEEC